jgi:tol-pal system protein YbgF
MKASRSVAYLLLSCLPLLSPAAFAQSADNGQTNDRISRIEHDVMLIQRQISRDGTHGVGGGDANIPAGGSAQLEVRLSAIEDQLRELRGKVEETDNRTAKLTENFEKLQKDVDFRFNELSNAAPKPLAAATPANLGESSGSGASVKPLLESSAAKPQPSAPVPAKAAEPSASKSALDLANFSSPRELYNYAFRLLNQTQYEEAANAFDSFTKKYPKDPLVGNAFYWEGETYYIRRDYVNAADYFRQGFEAMPEGPKAPDNLLKLAMSLDALSREKEACLVLQQIMSKFKKTASSTVDKAEAEAKRVGCHKT